MAEHDGAGQLLSLALALSNAVNLLLQLQDIRLSSTLLPQDDILLSGKKAASLMQATSWR